ncbi:MAG: Na+ dependent nucleoside transporter, partial [Flavobacteriales bacterium]|nr:Na+ dependent nucleoside transporter [Flavobacteriales bacterium]
MRNKPSRVLLTLLALAPGALMAQGGPAPLSGFSAMSLIRGILGMVAIVGIAWIFSAKRKQVNWRTVGIGLAFQLVMALLVLYVPPVQMAFEFVGKLFVKVLDFTRIGSEFVFGSLMDVKSMGFIFALQILPTIIFFSALTSVLFYLGIIQKVVYGLAWALNRSMRLSGAESLSTAGNIFLGQTEAPLMVKAYLDKMNRSEIFLVMTAGMATVAGGVLAAYVGFLGGDDPVQRLFFAKHLLTASVMAAPGAVVVAKILFPQTETIEQKLEVSMDQVGSNFLDAMSNGTTEGLKLAANVGAMLLVFFAFIAMFNYAFLKFGDAVGLNAWVASVSGGRFNGLSLEFMLGYLFAPIMWLIGVASEDITLTGQLVGQKVIAS